MCVHGCGCVFVMVTHGYIWYERERGEKKSETVGEFRWISCGDDSGKKGNWKREAWVWFWGFSKWGPWDGWVWPHDFVCFVCVCVSVCVCVCVFSCVFVEADRHKHIWIHCPEPPLCLVRRPRRTTQDLSLSHASENVATLLLLILPQTSNPSAYLTVGLI